MKFQRNFSGVGYLKTDLFALHAGAWAGLAHVRMHAGMHIFEIRRMCNFTRMARGGERTAC